MNWLERARREFTGFAMGGTANTAERNLMAVTAVLQPGTREESAASIGSNDSALPAQIHGSEAACEAFEERAAIMEFDGDLRRDEAERSARTLIVKRRWLH